jgi:Uma2 family endonuclease
MTAGHNHVQSELARDLMLRLTEHEYSVHCNPGRLRVSKDTYFVPDLFVVPRAFVDQRLRWIPDQLEVYDRTIPLVVKVWSPVVGGYDVEENLRRYQQRGDWEIWRVHPCDKTLTAWQREGGAHSAALHQRGAGQPASLPGVGIELQRLFE